MLLTEADKIMGPILRSDIFKTNISLQAKAEEIKVLFKDFKLTNTWKLNQFEELDQEKSKAIKELGDMYEELTT